MKYAFFILFCLFECSAGSTCQCSEPRQNQISPVSFGMTLLSPSFTARYFNVSLEKHFIIREASEPIWFSENKYFWDNEYYKSKENANHPTTCVYRISYYDKELRRIRYENGTRPSNITFGCHWHSECCDLGCCTNGVVQVTIYILLYTGILMFLIVFCSQLPTESDEERRRRRSGAELRFFFPCQRPQRIEREEHVLREIVNQDGPPKYDDLYPNGVGYVEFETFSEHLHDRNNIEKHFTYDNTTDIYSIDRKATIQFNNNHYFWDDYYEPFMNRTKVCTLKLTKYHDDLEHVVFSDGLRPTQLVFGCRSDQECCEVGCCEIHKYFYFYLIYPSCMVMVIIACAARQRRERDGRVRPRSRGS